MSKHGIAEISSSVILDVFDWVVQHPEHVNFIADAVNHNYPERVYHAVLAFPRDVYGYADPINGNMVGFKESDDPDNKCDFVFRQGPQMIMQCGCEGVPIRGKIRCSFHAAFIFDLIDQADPVESLYMSLYFDNLRSQKLDTKSKVSGHKNDEVPVIKVSENTLSSDLKDLECEISSINVSNNVVLSEFTSRIDCHNNRQNEHNEHNEHNEYNEHSEHNEHSEQKDQKEQIDEFETY